MWIDYSGEVDEKGNASGYGVAKREDLPGWKYEGTFLNDKLHGYGTLIQTLIDIVYRCNNGIRVTCEEH